MPTILLRVITLLSALLTVGALGAEPTRVDVRVIASGAKFLGGHAASVQVVLSDADTGEILQRGLTSGGTGETARIMQAGTRARQVLSSADSAVFHGTLDLDRPRRVSLSVTGPLGQPQASSTATSTRWLLPGRHLTAGDGWLVELPGLVVDIASPFAYQRVQVGKSLPLHASVSLLCGCNLSASGPWRIDETEVLVRHVINGKLQPLRPLHFDADTYLFVTDLPVTEAGIHELEVQAWRGRENNAGVARTTFFVD